MQKIKGIMDLKSAIQQLEYTQAMEWGLLKEQIIDTCENLKPINIIKDTLKEAYSTPDFKAIILKTIINFTTGFIARKAFIGKSPNILIKLLGFIMDKSSLPA